MCREREPLSGMAICLTIAIPGLDGTESEVYVPYPFSPCPPWNAYALTARD